MKRYEIAIIVAMARNNAIGKDGKLPWAIPSEMALFTRVTRARSVVMGANTARSIGPALKGRTCFVAASRGTRQLIDDGYIVFPTLDECLEQAANFEECRGNRVPREMPPQVWVIGGASIYKELLPRADYLYVSDIDLDVPDADTFFPEIPKEGWRIKHNVLRVEPLLHEETGEVAVPGWSHRTLFKEGSAMARCNEEWLKKKLTERAPDASDYLNIWTTPRDNPLHFANECDVVGKPAPTPEDEARLSATLDKIFGHKDQP